MVLVTARRYGRFRDFNVWVVIRKTFCECLNYPTQKDRRSPVFVWNPFLSQFFKLRKIRKALILRYIKECSMSNSKWSFSPLIFLEAPKDASFHDSLQSIFAGEGQVSYGGHYLRLFFNNKKFQWKNFIRKTLFLLRISQNPNKLFLFSVWDDIYEFELIIGKEVILIN